MNPIKTYIQVNRSDADRSFRISRMEDIYAERNGQTDVPHRHDYFTILLTREANGQHFIDFNEYPLRDRQAFFIGPGQVHQVVEKAPSYGYSMVFSHQFLIKNQIPSSFIEDLNLFHDYGHAPPLEPDAAQWDRLAGYCEEICGYYDSGEKFSDQAIGALLKLFLIHCNNICSLPFDDPHRQESAGSLLKQFKSLLEDHYTDWHTTSAYAEALHITPDHLNRSIKTITGKTAKEFIQSRITVAAKRMLYFSDLSVKEIGYALGFSEPANFSAFFKKCTGISPSKFKAKG